MYNPTKLRFRFGIVYIGTAWTVYVFIIKSENKNVYNINYFAV